MKAIGLIFLLIVFIGAVYECRKEYGMGIAIASMAIGLAIGLIVKWIAR